MHSRIANGEIRMLSLKGKRFAASMLQEHFDSVRCITSSLTQRIQIDQDGIIDYSASSPLPFVDPINIPDNIVWVTGEKNGKTLDVIFTFVEVEESALRSAREWEVSHGYATA